MSNNQLIGLEGGDCIACGSDHGGVGKTMLAQMYISRCIMQGVMPQILEIEAEPRLQRIYGVEAVRLFRVNERSQREIEADPSLLYAMWDEVCECVRASRRPTMLDIGANMTKNLAAYLAEYGDEGPFADGHRFAFLSVTTGDKHALTSAQMALGYIAQALPGSHRYLAVNEKDPLFPVPPDSLGLKRLIDAHGCGVLRLPRCLSPVLADVVDMHMPFHEAAAREPSFWEKERQYRYSEAVRGARRLAKFLADGITLFDPLLGPLPQVAIGKS